MADQYEKEIKILNSLYSEIAEAITNKPSTQDYENSRIYFENVAARMNGWAAQVKDIKNSLENREPIKDLTTDNRPA